jgi:uncharacterized protein DUF4032/lipopolysaccharide kinase (Kdo/WaaP) family protein
VNFQMVRRTGHPDFLDLPWQLPLERWRSERLVRMSRGLSRHVVRFVRYDSAVYALKELPRRLAEREYRLLSELARLSIPVVEVAAVVVDREGGEDVAPSSRRSPELDAILITRHLDFSLPYRAVLGTPGLDDLSDRLLDALANLLVRLHLAGFFWGDCSLSNTLFRRDAGALAAYVVDVETGELHPQLSDGQREHDLLVAEENMTGELLDMAAAGRLPAGIDPFSTAAELRDRYGFLWLELTREQVIPADKRYLIDERLRRLNALGFDVDEVELVADGEGYRLRLQPRVVEPDHHARTLQALTGLQVQENQARRILNDLAQFRSRLQKGRSATLPEGVVAYRWLSEMFEPTVQSIPADLRGRLEPAELYHELLEHRWFLSEAAGHDVGLEETVRSFVENVLSQVPEPVPEPDQPASDPADAPGGQPA